jgi:lipopolysaccharide transport system ATP-binding protein
MSDVAIRVEGLGKQYRIGGRRARYRTIRESITSALLSPFRRARALVRGRGWSPTGRSETIWALRDVSFDVERGEVLGIIGRNGAGKTTLLKLLSRITEPTEGWAEIHGRVGSLLEVGTGFHPELTGRENIYLNGAILGMKRAEIERKFDQIVAFSEIEEFLDTPVKHYSSGMYVRLAFAVAAHLEPEVLLVDEVLAVGDAAFQRKCLGKMGDVAREGRTVLFVSHNMAAVLSLCSQAYLLDRGRVACRGAAEEVVATYMQNSAAVGAVPLHERTDRRGDGRARLTSVCIEGATGSSAIRCSDSLRVRIGYEAGHGLRGTSFVVRVVDQFRRPVFVLDSEMAGGLPNELPATGSVLCVTGPVNLTPGPCSVNIAVQVGGALADHVKDVCSFDVEPDDFHGTGKLPGRQEALLLLRQDWRVEPEEGTGGSAAG